jgi:hypothetical protein
MIFPCRDAAMSEEAKCDLIDAKVIQTDAAVWVLFYRK